jgi:carboxyl-terminal processing protease
VVQVKDPTGDVGVGSDPDPTIAYSGPLVVLVNRGTASASEILAGALQDYGRAVIVGDSSTFGKGTVQTLESLAPVFKEMNIETKGDPGAIKLTIQKFYRPSGASTQLKGVASDIVLPSLTDQPELSEKAMDNPLPWDTIPASDYKKAGKVKPYLPTLKKRSEARVAKDKDFAHLRQEIAHYQETAGAKRVSLNEAERRKAVKAEKARQEAWKKELAARPKSKERVYEVTVKQACAPGLPPAKAAGYLTVQAKTAASETPLNGEKPVGPDAILEEGKRILADLISLSAKK